MSISEKLIGFTTEELVNELVNRANEIIILSYHNGPHGEPWHEWRYKGTENVCLGMCMKLSMNIAKDQK